MSANTLGKAIPVFRVESVSAAIEYYTGALGFRHDWGTDGFASVSRDKATIFLCEGDQGHRGTWVWIGVNDAAALEGEFRARGGKIRHACTNYPWALEMQVEDPDGNILRFGSDSIAGQPYGEWLDMDGRTWPPMGGSGAACE
jgi:catechol 2,3-dioxygenase-like lactoylglutathione lyase family enzyme